MAMTTNHILFAGVLMFLFSVRRTVFVEPGVKPPDENAHRNSQPRRGFSVEKPLRGWGFLGIACSGGFTPGSAKNGPSDRKQNIKNNRNKYIDNKKVRFI